MVAGQQKGLTAQMPSLPLESPMAFSEVAIVGADTAGPDRDHLPPRRRKRKKRGELYREFASETSAHGFRWTVDCADPVGRILWPVLIAAAILAAFGSVLTGGLSKQHYQLSAYIRSNSDKTPALYSVQYIADILLYLRTVFTSIYCYTTAVLHYVSMTLVRSTISSSVSQDYLEGPRYASEYNLIDGRAFPSVTSNGTTMPDVTVCNPNPWVEVRATFFKKSGCLYKSLIALLTRRSLRLSTFPTKWFPT